MLAASRAGRLLGGAGAAGRRGSITPSGSTTPAILSGSSNTTRTLLTASRLTPSAPASSALLARKAQSSSSSTTHLLRSPAVHAGRGRPLSTTAARKDAAATTTAPESGTLTSPSDLARKLSEAVLPRIPRPDVKKVLVVGSGGLSIGQAGEFDYSGACSLSVCQVVLCVSRPSRSPPRMTLLLQKPSHRGGEWLYVLSQELDNLRLNTATLPPLSTHPLRRGEPGADLVPLSTLRLPSHQGSPRVQRRDDPHQPKHCDHPDLAPPRIGNLLPPHHRRLCRVRH